MKDNMWFCPLYEKEISETLCVEVNLELSHAVVKEHIIFLNKFKGLNIQNIDKICELCPNQPNKPL